MRRGTLLLLATIGAMLVAATSVALAAASDPPWFGSDTNDSYCGNGKPNIADGRGGADTMFAKGGSDYLSGGEGNDAGTGNKDPNLGTPVTGLNCFGEEVPAAVRGGGDADFIGVDKVAGKIPGASDDGSDDLVGNEGNDEIADTKNAADDYDRVWGGTGDDKVNVADGDTHDQVDCGDGSSDEAKIDVIYAPDPVTGKVKRDDNGKPIDPDVVERDQTWYCDGHLFDQDGWPVDPTDAYTVSENQLSENQLSAADEGSAAGEAGGPPPEPAARGPKPNKQRS